MRIAEGQLRRIIKEELRREVNHRAVAASKLWVEWSLKNGDVRFLNESWQGGEIELGAINGRVVARMLNDGGETLIASLIMNHDRPGANEYIWDQILNKGRERSRSWEVDFPLDQAVYRGMSLHDMGFRNGKIIVLAGFTLGQAGFYDYSERISDELRIDVKFTADDRHGEHVILGTLRPGGLRSSGKYSPPAQSLEDIKHSSFSLQEVSLDYLDHLVLRRHAAMFI